MAEMPQPHAPRPPGLDQPPPGSLRHTPLEDAIAFLSAAVLVGLGVALFEKAGLVTGGTAGLALLLSYRFGIGFGPAFVLVNLPFFALAVFRMGWRFTMKTIAAVGLLAAISELQRPLLGLGAIHAGYAAPVGGLLVGVGLLILFRHRGSLGGFNVLALYLQERTGWRAGWLQLGLDAAVVLLSLAVVAPEVVAVSLVGALTLNLTLAINHRPGRYVGM
ncbi:YitT family protein [Zeimonas sediminis]|uniref:YitT family protein n=1 Tax=Zeimonas sediminis TaxID=2944268 RepID=UPI00300E1D09